VIFDNVLDDCLNRLQKGETIEDCLRRYPEYADQLTPLLGVAQHLHAAPPPQMKPTAFAKGQRDLLTAVSNR